MNYLIIGAGGTGGCLSAYLARAGHAVTVIARGAHLEAIRHSGLTLRSCTLGEVRPSQIEACTAEEYKGNPDVIYVCVKYYSLGEIVPLLARVAGKDTAVIPIVNVFGTGGILAEQLPHSEILDGCIYLNAMIDGPGVIAQPSPIFKLRFGYRPGQPRSLEDKVRMAEKEAREAGIDALFTEDIRTEALRKFSHVSPMGATGLYHGTRAGDIVQRDEVGKTFLALVEEIAALGHAMGIDLGEDLAERNMEITRSLSPDATSSLQRDVAAARTSEIDGLIHRVVRLGREYGVPVPTYETISVKLSEDGIR